MDRNSERKTGKASAVFVLVFAALSAVCSIALNVMRKFALMERDAGSYTAGKIYGEEAIFFVLLLLVGAATFLLIRFVALSRLMRVETGITVAVLVLTLIVFWIPSVYHAGYLRLPFWAHYVYLPGLFALALFPTAYAAGKTPTRRASYMPMVFLPLLCVAAVLTLTRSYALLLTTVLTAILFSVKLIRDRKTSGARGALIAGALILLAALAAYALLRVPQMSDRFAAVFSGGESDPEGLGWIYVRLRTALGSAKVFGTSDCVLHDMPAFRFFAQVKDSSAPLVILLKYGWAGLAAVVAAAVGLIVSLFRVAAKAQDAFCKDFAFLTACFFIARVAVALLSDFLMFFSHSYLPFFADRATVLTDTVLVCAAVALFLGRKRTDAKTKE